MAETIYKTIFQIRRGSSKEWESVNPILREGEPGWDTTLRKQKMGDGKTPWNELPYQEDMIPSIDVINCGNATIK